MSLINFIHTGDYKTGTTWMQHHAFEEHPEITYLGGPFKDKEFEKLLFALVRSRDLDFDSKKIAQQFRKRILPLSTSKITGISREGLSASDIITGENALRTALRIKEVFGVPKIIFVISSSWISSCCAPFWR